MKTPWNPSRKAIARVKNPLPFPQSCPHCGAECVFSNNSAVYGREYGEWPWIVLCNGCRAYVGLHPFTGIPLGMLADASTRGARKRAKAAFNPLWQCGGMTRSQAYAWLANALGMDDVEQCHIGWFDVQQCDMVVCAIKNKEASHGAARP